MKKLFGIIPIFIFMFNLIIAQENLFEKVNTDHIVSKATNKKIECFKARKALKQWELILLKQNIILSKNFKGVFNIFDKNLEFEITEDYREDVQGIHGFIANLNFGGYAVISSFKEGITATIFYAEHIFNIEVVDNNLYFISEINLEEISCDSPSDYGDLIREDNSFLTERDFRSVTPATIKVLVVCTSAVAQNYNVSTLINQCLTTTTAAYQNSQVSTTIELAGSAQVTYNESGNALTDVNRFKGTNDGYMDNVHYLRDQFDADICVLIVDDLDECGRVPNGAIPADYSEAFCVVEASCAVTNYSFAHEIGHLLGCRHDSDPSNDPYTYCHGYQGYWKLYNVKRSYRTVMSTFILEKYQRVPYFSNPNVYDQEGTAMGTTTSNNCRLTIDNIAPTVASFEGAEPEIDYISQDPNPLYNGGTGYVHAHLSKGEGEITYSWSETHYPAMTVNLTPLGSSCQVHYYLPYHTNYDIFITCTASNAYGSDTNTYRLLCQYYPYYGLASLTFEKDGVLIDENPILVSSLNNPGADITDYYVINEKISPENGTIKFFLHESENAKEYANLDQVELWEVKTHKNKFVAITEEGEVISYKNLEKPNQIVLNDSEDLTGILEDRDELKLTVNKGDRIKITLPSNTDYTQKNYTVFFMHNYMIMKKQVCLQKMIT